MDRVLVFGAGISGISATKLLLSMNLKVLLYEENKNVDIEKIKREIGDNENLEIKTNIFDRDFKDVSLIVISPGIPKTNETYLLMKNKNIPIISELELGFLQSKGKIVAITGSNGKTTVTTLVGEILKKHYEKTFVVGNVGEAITSHVKEMDDNSATVIECSSFQLEDIVKFKPNIATILNFSCDHLERYESYTNYINAKLRIAMNMDANDILVLNYEDDIIRNLSVHQNAFKAKIVFFSSERKLADGFYVFKDSIYLKDSIKTIKLLDIKDLKLVGKHNIENVMASMAIGYYMGVSLSDIVDVCKDFKTLPHRIEFVAEIGKVKYYNDSKATNPDATIKALDCMEGKVILIAGGHDKGIDFGDLIVKIKEKVKYLILIGEAKKIIAAKARMVGFEDIIYADTLKDAVKISKSYANVNDVVLLSPACSSYDMFKNYMERGDKFKEYVKSV